MGTPRLTGFLIGVLFVGFFVGVLGIFLSNVSVTYSPSGYDNSSLAVYNQMQTLSNQVNTYKSNITAIRSDYSLLEKGVDLFGGIFSSAWSAVKLTIGSIDLTTTMISEGENELAQNAPIGAVAGYLKLLIGTLLTIVIVIGIGLALLLSREKL